MNVVFSNLFRLKI